MNKITRGAMVTASALSVLALAAPANAAYTSYTQTFEKGYNSVLDADTGDWAGDIQKVRSGKAGHVESIDGSKFHAIATEGQYPGSPQYTTGPFTRFGGYSTEFGDGFNTSVAVYLDPALAEGEGFEWTVAANGVDGKHQRDFIFHVKKVGDNIMVGADNNSGWASDQLSMPANAVPVEAGWATLTHEFKNVDGVLAVDMLVNGHKVATRTNAADEIDTEVGGNRYGWFTMIEADSVAVDNIVLESR